MSYYVIYRNDEHNEPSGLFVVDAGIGDAVLWDHRAGEWTYNPDLVVRFLDDYRNADRYRNVSRAAAEAVAPTVTGNGELPDESSIRAMFVGGADDR
ncbi:MULTISPECIES: hypothetical protein [unclassified Micromonospora]|uniref:hypothetical protein n=1 Tax=unclassified Micromonospora TaxID=2617518 RepID=UPI0033DA4260